MAELNRSLNNSRFIVFGDVHGCNKAAETAIKLAEELSITAIFLGDYIDRGPNSVETLLKLIEAKKRNPDWVFIKGNHEFMLLNLLNDNSLIDTNEKLRTGDNYSYYETSKTYQNLVLTNTLFMDQVKLFLEELLLFYETPNWIFVHSVLNNDAIALQNKDEEVLLWNYNPNPKWLIKNYIHGHDRVNEINQQGAGININTNCGFGGHLTGLLIDSENKQFIKSYHISEDGLLINI